MTDDGILSNYGRDGYLVQRGILAAAELDPVREFLAAEVDAYAGRMLAEGKIGSLHAEQPFERRFASICREMDFSPRNWIGSGFDRVFYDLYRLPAIVRVLAGLLGPEVVQLGALNIRTKLPDAEITSFPWHQDSHYYNEPSRGRKVGYTEAAHIVTVWVPLVDATVANGCLWVAARQPPLGPDRRGARRGHERARHRGRRAARDSDPGGDAGGRRSVPDQPHLSCQQDEPDRGIALERRLPLSRRACGAERPSARRAGRPARPPASLRPRARCRC